ncbi:helix-turn-helix domain-containing protein [Marinomonas gallaica]|nr:helix-turn-helix domain-containing protein [Marinomonas gallaica]
MPANTKTDLNSQKVLAVKLRLKGVTVEETVKQTKLSAPTVIKCHKLFLTGGWQALNEPSHGRKKGQGTKLSQDVLQQLICQLFMEQPFLWSRQSLASYIKEQFECSVSERAASHLANDLGLLSGPYKLSDLVNINGRKALKRSGVLEQTGKRVYLGYCHSVNRFAPSSLNDQDKKYQGVLLILQSPKNKQLWSVCEWPSEAWLKRCFEILLAEVNHNIVLIVVGLDLTRVHSLNQWLLSEPIKNRLQVVAVPSKHSCLPA